MVSGSDGEAKLVHCPALVTVRTISGKWKTRILWLLRSGPMQFGELRRGLKGVSAKVLSQHLDELVEDGLVHRAVAHSGAVQTVRYSFTDYGRTLVPVLDALGHWGQVHEARAPR